MSHPCRKQLRGPYCGLDFRHIGSVGLDVRSHPVWHNHKSEYGQCSWCVTRDGTLYVRTHLGSKSTQLGSHPPDLLARILMKEINAQAKCADGC
jgi:hypothetical protein